MAKYPKPAEAIQPQPEETDEHITDVLHAYFDFLELLYSTDNTGLADMLGVDPGTLQDYRNRPWVECGVGVISRAARMTGIPASLLIRQ